MYKISVFAPIFLFIWLSGAASYAVDLSPDYSKGPLLGKNLYIPFLIHYNFPSLQAKSGEQFDFQYHLSLYYVNDASYTPRNPKTFYSEERNYDTENVLRDYESLVVELGTAFNIFKNLQAGMDMRVFSYYGGFMDQIIDGVHDFINLKASRDYFLRNQMYVNIPNNNGIAMYLDEPAAAFGDIDLWGKWTFFENRRLSLAALGAFKLPTGSLSALSGSDYPDAALGLLLDNRALRFLTLYTQAGLVLPFNNKSHPMFNGLVGFEVHPWRPISLNLQMNIKTSPITENTIHFSYTKFLGVNTANYYQYSLPQINLLAGLVIRHCDFTCQIYFEEDFIFNQSTDITLNVMFLHKIKKGADFRLTPFFTSIFNY